MIKDAPIRIQILATNGEAGAAGAAIATAEARRQEIAAIGKGQGAEALLVCPAPEEFVAEGIDLVIAARFRHELDEETVFWRQHDLASDIDRGLKVRSHVVDLDRPLDRFLRHIAYMLTVRYRDELGRLGDI